MNNHMVYGVISHQGDFHLHENVIKRIGRKTAKVLTADDLEKVDALIIPGGESTTLIRFFDRLNLWDTLIARIRGGMPVFGTCAGIILLAKNSNGQRSLGVIDVDVKRNAYGRQVDSFEATLESPVFNSKPLKGVFIRAPRIIRVGEGVEVLATLDGEAVLVKYGKVLGATFHPELTDDKRVHELFIKIAET